MSVMVGQGSGLAPLSQAFLTLDVPAVDQRLQVDIDGVNLCHASFRHRGQNGRSG